jgi:undecaprenyl-diphosphatase
MRGHYISGIGLSLLLGGAVWPGLVTLAAGEGVAWSRLFLGVHFPLDMLGAVGVACLSYAVVSPAWRTLGVGLTPFAERFYRKAMARPIERGWIRR